MKARNRLDRQFYALKKIRVMFDDPNAEKLLREVTTLSHLNHPHVVRYFNAWIEPAGPGVFSRILMLATCSSIDFLF